MEYFELDRIKRGCVITYGIFNSPIAMGNRVDEPIGWLYNFVNISTV